MQCIPVEEFHRWLSQLGTSGCHPGCSTTCPLHQALQIRIQEEFCSPALEERYFICSFITSFPSWPWAQSKLLRTTSRNRPGSWDNKSTKASSLSPICRIKIKLLISPEHPQPCHPSFFLSSHPSAFTLEKKLVTTHHFQPKDTGFWSHRDASGDALNV